MTTELPADGLATPAFRCGKIAVVGRPNSGKSTLVNRLVGEKVSIVSAVPQTTRTNVLGIRNEEGVQFVLVDTPGIHLAKHELNRRMVEEAHAAMGEVDVAVHVVDAAGHPGRGDDFVTDWLVKSRVPFVVALNKVDLISQKAKLLPLMQRFDANGKSQGVVPISAHDGSGVDALLGELRRLLPEAPPQYPPDIRTDQTERFFIAELIREKVLHATREEVPHATAVFIEQVEERVRDDGGHVLVIHAALGVEKENQKGILIGKGGEMLKRMGTAARKDVEETLGVRCHLQLHVKVVPRWRDRREVLAEIFSGNRGVGALSADELLRDLAPPPKDEAE